MVAGLGCVASCFRVRSAWLERVIAQLGGFTIHRRLNSWDIVRRGIKHDRKEARVSTEE